MNKLKNLIDKLNEEFLRREEVVRGLAIGLITRNNVLLIGPPGTAKSMLVNQLAEKLDGMKYFGYLMTKFTRPDEILGPISLKGLERDELNRVLEGRLADAHMAFLDEVFNSNSGCLNAILSIMNERRILNGTKVIEVPLMMLVGAANEIPAEISGELSAFYDRFLFRYRVDYLSAAGELQELISGVERKFGESAISLQELERIQEQVLRVKISEGVLARIVAIVLELRRQGVLVSDRRVKQSCQALKAAALLEGRDEVSFDDLDQLKDIYWHYPRDKEIFSEVWAFFQKPVLDRVNMITWEAQTLYKDLAVTQLNLGDGTQAGARMLELKEELLGMLNLYGKDYQLGEAIEAGMGQVDNLVAKLFQNMVSGNGGQYLQ